MSDELFFGKKMAYGVTDLVHLLRSFERGLDQRLSAIEAEVKRLSGDVKPTAGAKDDAIWP